MRYESLKFVRNAHPGAIVGPDQRMHFGNIRVHLSTYLNRYSRPWYMNALSILHVCSCNAFSISSVSIHVRIANSVLSWSLIVGSRRTRKHAFQSSIPRRYSAQTVSFPRVPSQCVCECEDNNDSPGNNIEYYRLGKLTLTFEPVIRVNVRSTDPSRKSLSASSLWPRHRKCGQR